MQYRIEHDLLGDKKIDDNAYYGINTQRAMENFKISSNTIGQVPIFVKAMAKVKKACALANNDLRVLPDDVTEAIVYACDRIIFDGEYIDQFPIDVFQGGAGTSVNMNANEVIANIALEHVGKKKGEYKFINPNDHVNKSQSTNDAYPTGFRIATYEMVVDLLERIKKLADSFEKKSSEFADVIKMGRTQLQDAVPMTLGSEFKGFTVNLLEEIKTLKLASNLLLEVNLGATAIGTGVNTPDGYTEKVSNRLAEVTGYKILPAENLLEATSDNGAYVFVHAGLKRLAVKLSKICNDLRLLSSGPRAGFAEINLPQMQAGSSIMPAKVNPVIPEVVNQVAFKVVGNDVCVTLAAEAGQLQLNVMEPCLAQAMFESISLLANACDTLRKRCVDGITANKKVCYDYVMNSIGLVTYLNDVIGHHKGDEIGKIAAKTGKSIREIVLEENILPEEKLNEILNKENLINPKYKGEFYEKGQKTIF